MCHNKKLLKRNLSSSDLNTRNEGPVDMNYSAPHAPQRPQSLERWASQTLHEPQNDYDHGYDYYDYNEWNDYEDYLQQPYDRHRHPYKEHRDYRDYRDVSPSYYGKLSTPNYLGLYICTYTIL